MKRALSCVMTLALAVAVGCQKHPEPAPAASASASATPPPSVSTAAPGVPADSAEIPTTEDFEQEALDSVNPQNIQQELDKLEQEIGK